MRTKALTSKSLANKVAKLADDKKAQDIVVLNMRDLVNFCDYFVIATGTSDRQVKAIAQGISEGLADFGIDAHLGKSFKGLPVSSDVSEGAWVLLDMGDVVAHIFEPKAREFYGLEYLWQNAPRVPYKPAKRTKKI